MRWCAEVQLALLAVEWPEAMLRWPDCAAEADPSTGALIFRGLRVRMGMAFGRAQHRKPLNTGQFSCEPFVQIMWIIPRLWVAARKIDSALVQLLSTLLQHPYQKSEQSPEKSADCSTLESPDCPPQHVLALNMARKI